MPELHDLLSDEADRQQPPSNRPFTDLIKTRRRRDRNVRLAGAGVVGALVVAGIAFAGTSTGAGNGPSVVRGGDPSLAPTAPPAPKTSVSGTLELGAGPGHAPEGVAGVVTYTDETGLAQSVPVGTSGTFMVGIPTGTYTFTGTSPRYNVNGGQGTCRADQPVTVGSDDVTGIVVACRVL